MSEKQQYQSKDNNQMTNTKKRGRKRQVVIDRKVLLVGQTTPKKRQKTNQKKRQPLVNEKRQKKVAFAKSVGESESDSNLLMKQTVQKKLESKKNSKKYLPANAKKQAKKKTQVRLKQKKQWQLAQYKKKQQHQRIRTFGISIGVGILFTIIVLMYFFSITKVYGYSMLPTLADGDIVIINKQTKVTRYQLIAFRTTKGEVLVRRVVGLPGEKIELRQGKLYVNDEERVEFYLTKEETQQEEINSSLTDTGQEISGIQSVPEHTYYVLGDNRSYATDSRYFGPVLENQVIGVINMRQPEGE